MHFRTGYRSDKITKRDRGRITFISGPASKFCEASRVAHAIYWGSHRFRSWLRDFFPAWVFKPREARRGFAFLPAESRSTADWGLSTLDTSENQGSGLLYMEEAA